MSDRMLTMAEAVREAMSIAFDERPEFSYSVKMLVFMAVHLVCQGICITAMAQNAF